MSHICFPDFNFEETIKIFVHEVEKGREAVSEGLEIGFKTFCEGVEKGHEVLTHALGGATKCLRQVDGLRAITSATQTVIRGMEVYGISTVGFEKLIQTLKSAHDVITVRNIVLRLSEFVSGEAIWKHAKENFPNLVKLASRIAYIVSDTLNTLKFLEKYNLIARGTGNTFALKVFGEQLGPVAPALFGYVAVALDLADNISVAWDEGLNWDNGLAIGSTLTKFVSINVGDSENPALRILGIVSGATSSVLFFVKFVRTEYKL